ncbi:flavodoxin [Clostridium sp. D2Q-11]|uniref:Flavodoxin n=1 Tax=Anaeromonas frigoriresistens TaxID=2683708 RepID=A0A942Z6S1_9FIRM|nr:flavodoxin domain-containing protein [Anaeromonas frigoriresistens]MBS4538776.1 flavodoxin [Anaeromonas frigoriresistens]
MNNIVVIYQSKYGATKKYAEWLSEEFSCDIIETKKATIDEVEKYDVIILGGGIYATGISGISFIKKNYGRLKDKDIIVFAVGASPYDENAMTQLRERNFKMELSHIPCFYCRGAWNEEDMSWKDRTLCNLLKKAVEKKDSNTYEPWERALMEAVGSSNDWTDKEYIAQIIEHVQKAKPLGIAYYEAKHNNKN